MGILSWILFGMITGIVANIIDPYPERGGLIGAVILGILGAILGGILGNVVFGIGISGFNFPSFAVAVLGSLLLLFIGRAFGRA
ncbi:hypothetical protein A3C59_02130 [Candidatus Daviesbacteria bacterium RIFCSPHIGHO2_02_FULL_36_13]|uniref:Transglycosylase n=1 Tax=Candidatus Daviesbacteria bacterium RIFCSPHIGHO2_02_FULL_36_13 TaxID=1797768 RepID=A0A1F5JV99_9BACT|nr:MAG: hypothetical protein A3C59_02130 [Candidatus Daviesbacteria bacterium RIFCSPHIGHO2_02_FULL_36_13]OGE44711.1 MAG: hypothetical protein A3A45_00875 [Candidatus Daviesbacteria bacterium RIFCSPLOWO2_01_FULL_36_8]